MNKGSVFGSPGAGKQGNEKAKTGGSIFPPKSNIIWAFLSKLHVWNFTGVTQRDCFLTSSCPPRAPDLRQTNLLWTQKRVCCVLRGHCEMERRRVGFKI
eukprot:1314961-Amorphochlora_amoeboformis.AAC.1